MRCNFRVHRPMQEGIIYLDGTAESFNPQEWGRPFFDDEPYQKIVDGIPLVCTDIIWINPVKRCVYLAWRNTHSTKGPWMFGGRQRRGESPGEAAHRLLKNEIGSDVDPDELHFVQHAIAFSKYRAQEPQSNGAHYVLFHYCYVATEEMVENAAKKLEPKEYDVDRGIQPYTRADIEALDVEGPYSFNRTILLEEFDRIFGPEQKVSVSCVTSGHVNERRTIWDLVKGGDMGGNQPIHQLAYFTPVHAGAQIGGARVGFGHYHEKMWETYIILNGSCVMSLKDIKTGKTEHYDIDVKDGEHPWKIEIPPRFAHRLTAVTATHLLIAASDTQTTDDTFEIELEVR